VFRGGSTSNVGGVPSSSTTKFEKGPQIDTWTNETAENAEKDDIGGGCLQLYKYHQCAIHHIIFYVLFYIFIAVFLNIYFSY